MIGLSWNCRGLGSPRAEIALKGVVRLENPHFVFLMETKLKCKEWEGLKRQLNMGNFLCVYCDGDGRQRRSGLAMFWRDIVRLELQTCSLNHMDFIITGADNAQWRLTGIYRHLEEENKHETWNMLWRLGVSNTRPWLCFGDFNGILSHSEMRGGAPKQQAEIDGFRDAVSYCQLEEVYYEGLGFTWSNNREEGANIIERLNSFLASEDWMGLYPLSMVEHLSKRRSDHIQLKFAFRSR